VSSTSVAEPQGTPPSDIVVVSDLHLGRGKNQHTGRYYELEAFFYDEDFKRFCEHLCEEAEKRSAPLRLIFNGDTFDLLRLDPLPLPEELDQRHSSFAPVLTPHRAASEVSRILEGHPLFVEAIATVLHAGHYVTVLPGNHDIEIQWDPVHDAMREAIGSSRIFATKAEATEALERLEFRPWFYYEPGRLWIEHGCQYDPENAFQYPLRRGLVSAPDVLHQAELDNPLGNFFQRYLYNAFGHITFIVPSTRANARYMKWLAINQPQLLLRIFRSQWRFWWQVLRRVAKYPSRQRDRLAESHRRELEQLAAQSGLGKKLLTIDDLKELHADVFQAVRGFGLQALKFVLATLLVGSLVLGLWFAGYHGINQIQMGLLGKAFAFLMFGFVFLLSAFGAVLYTILRATEAVPPQPMRRAAAQIAGIVDVPIVSFGHSHDEVLWRNDRPKGKTSWYFNTGTWIAVFTHDVLLPRERVQFTFLRVRDHEAQLLHWSPGRGEPLPVVLIDEGGRISPGWRHPGDPPT
jgi:UDP-2,3-diacylglucosamine pyrophosphatase LpxH